MSAEGQAPERRHILIAARSRAFETLHGYLDAHVDLVAVETLGEALRTLEERHDIDLVVCTVNFDESRMFDLVRLVRAKYPEIPIVCCRTFEADVAKISLEALRIASESLGASLFIDVPSLKRQVGAERLGRDLQKAILRFRRVPS